MIPIKYIIQGWWNWLLDLVSDIKYKKEFDERLEICKICENNKHGICGICHCVLVAKTKSEDSECPVGKWKKIEH
jgi:hypothetical protein